MKSNKPEGYHLHNGCHNCIYTDTKQFIGLVVCIHDEVFRRDGTKKEGGCRYIVDSYGHCPNWKLRR